MSEKRKPVTASAAAFAKKRKLATENNKKVNHENEEGRNENEETSNMVVVENKKADNHQDHENDPNQQLDVDINASQATRSKIAKKRDWRTVLKNETVKNAIIEIKGRTNSNMEASYQILSSKEDKFPPIFTNEPLSVKFWSWGDGLGASKEATAGPDKKQFCVFLGIGCPETVKARDDMFMKKQQDENVPEHLRTKPLRTQQLEFMDALIKHVDCWLLKLWENPNFRPAFKNLLRNGAYALLSRARKVDIKEITAEEAEEEAKQTFFMKATKPFKYPNATSEFKDDGPVLILNRYVWQQPYDPSKSDNKYKKPTAKVVGTFKDAKLKAIYDEMNSKGFTYNAPLVANAKGVVKPPKDDLAESQIKFSDLVRTDIRLSIFSQIESDKSHYGIHAYFGNLQVIASGPANSVGFTAYESHYADNEDDIKIVTTNQPAPNITTPQVPPVVDPKKDTPAPNLWAQSKQQQQQQQQQRPPTKKVQPPPPPPPPPQNEEEFEEFPASQEME